MRYLHNDGRFRTESKNSHSAFTLVELLIVLGLIALLFSLIAVAAMSSIGGAKITATRGTMTKIQGMIKERIEALNQRPIDPPAVQFYFTLAGNNSKRAEVLARKALFRQAFPQSWQELATYSAGLLAQSSETQGVPPAIGTPSEAAESAEVLYFMLTKANVLGFTPEGTDAFSSSEIGDTDADGKLELIDAWGKPFRFYRWPTRLIRGSAYTIGLPKLDYSTVPAEAKVLIPTLPATTGDASRDTDDPYGQLAPLVGPGNGSWKLTPAEVAAFESGSGVFAPPIGPFHTLATYSTPLVVSAGPDGELGLFEPWRWQGGVFGHLANVESAASTIDNITNHNTRSGGN